MSTIINIFIIISVIIAVLLAGFGLIILGMMIEEMLKRFSLLKRIIIGMWLGARVLLLLVGIVAGVALLWGVIFLLIGTAMQAFWNTVISVVLILALIGGIDSLLNVDS